MKLFNLSALPFARKKDVHSPNNRINRILRLNFSSIEMLSGFKLIVLDDSLSSAEIESQH